MHRETLGCVVKEQLPGTCPQFVEGNILLEPGRTSSGSL